MFLEVLEYSIPKKQSLSFLS